MLPLCESLDNIDQTTIRLQSLRRESWERATVIVWIELARLKMLSSALSQTSFSREFSRGVLADSFLRSPTGPEA
jgi:hypothetical protein